MKLYQATEMRRELATQEARIVLQKIPDGDAPVGSHREVQILVPEGNALFVGIDMKPQTGATPEGAGIGPNRTYTVPPMPTGQAIVIRLQPQQYLMAMSGSGLVGLALIIEYIED